MSVTYVAGVFSFAYALIRFWEPMILKALKETLCCKKKRKTDDLYQENTLNSFLNSAVNIELVVLMLRGITQSMKQREKLLGCDAKAMIDSTGTFEDSLSIKVPMKKI